MRDCVSCGATALRWISEMFYQLLSTLNAAIRFITVGHIYRYFRSMSTTQKASTKLLTQITRTEWTLQVDVLPVFGRVTTNQ